MGKNEKAQNGRGRREFSSGGVVFRKEKGKTLWLIAKTVPSILFPSAVWRLPKGWIDDAGDMVPGPMASGKIRADEESLRETAAREVMEEGGVEAEIIIKIGSVKYFYRFPGVGNILKFVTFYLMEWKRDLPEGFDGETSEIAWLTFEEAHKTLSFTGEKQVLKKANAILNNFF